MGSGDGEGGVLAGGVQGGAPLNGLDSLAPSGSQLDALEASALAVAREQLAAFSPADLGDHLRRLRRVIDRLEGESSRRLARFEELGGPAGEGASSAIAFLQFQCGLDPGGAAERVLLARSRSDLASTTAALSSGQISYDQAAIIAGGASEVSPADAPEVERRSLAAAVEQMDARRLRHFTKGVVAEVDAEALRRDARRAHSRRALRIGPDRDGSARVEGLLESECAAYLRMVTDSLMGPKSRDDDRSAPQRRHDALRDALKDMLGGGIKLPKVGGQRPHITVVAPLSAMLDEPGPPALLQGLVPISPETLKELSAEGSLSATLVHANGRIAYSGKARAYSVPKRRALAAATGACPWPGGCDRPAEWCDGHHIDPYAHGGVTDVDNGELLCGFHHGLVERSGWVIVRGANGERRAFPPGHPSNPSTELDALADLGSGSSEAWGAGP